MNGLYGIRHDAKDAVNFSRSQYCCKERKYIYGNIGKQRRMAG